MALVNENVPEPSPAQPVGGPDSSASSPEAVGGAPAQEQPPPQAEAPAPSQTPPTAEQAAPPTPPATPPSPPLPEKPTVIVRYSLTGILGRFTCTLEGWKRGQRVVIKSDRGQEMGEIVCPSASACFRQNVSEKVVGEVLRFATHADEIEERHMHDGEERELAFCRERIAARGLPMRLVQAEHLFGGDRIIFYFLSESRVDFRALVRDLAHEFQTRIEMRQIGARDEARLLGDYERCGRPLCCRAWIKDLAPVSMRMAKSQKATLDPAKISGHCGRLMCCLRFEHETYRELARLLPRRNSYVATPDGVGKVVATDAVTQMVAVLLARGTRIHVPVESILERDVNPKEVEGTETGPARAAPAPASPPPPAPAAPARSPAAEKAEAATQDDSEKRRGRRGRRRSRRGGRRRNRNPDGSPPTGSQDGSSGPSANQGAKPPQAHQGD
jgi:cell fate regulator YaaT (PSP1 superfamily)